MADQDSEPSLTSCAMARHTGTFQVHRLRDGWIDMDTFRRTNHYRISYEARGITDRMFLGIPINPDAETIFLIDRYGDAPRFNEREAQIAAYTMRGFKWFHREVMLSHGLGLADAPLSPMQRRIVNLLLTERTEKEIATELGQSPKTSRYRPDAEAPKQPCRSAAKVIACIEDPAVVNRILDHLEHQANSNRTLPLSGSGPAFVRQAG